MSKNTHLFADVQIDSANDLLSVLLPSSKSVIGWHDDVEGDGQQISRKWLFRGHGDASWDLIPSIFRDGAVSRLELYDYGDTTGVDSSSSDIHNLEMRALGLFCEYAQRKNIPVPGYTADVRDEFLNFIDEQRSTSTRPTIHWTHNARPWNNTSAPNHEVEQIIAIAQHQGVPTRFLDWTESPFVAVYFACIQFLDLVEKKYEKKDLPKFSDFIEVGNHELSIWVLNAKKAKSIHASVHLVVVDPPYMNNWNMTEQRGKFTYLIGNNHNEPIALNEYDGTSNSRLNLVHCLSRIKFPSRLIPELLYSLDANKISGLTLFDGYEGVRKYILEKKLASMSYKQMLLYFLASQSNTRINLLR